LRRCDVFVTISAGMSRLTILVLLILAASQVTSWPHLADELFDETSDLQEEQNLSEFFDLNEDVNENLDLFNMDGVFDEETDSIFPKEDANVEDVSEEMDKPGFRPGWKCNTFSGGRCRIGRMLGKYTPSFLKCKATGSFCDAGECSCRPGFCFNSATNACVPWVRPNYDQSKPNADQIVCPVLAAMYNAGDLVPDAQGRVERKELRDALMNGVGTRKTLATFQANGVAAFKAADVDQKNRLKCKPGSACWFKTLIGYKPKEQLRYLNIFKLAGNKFVEHAFSTGVRETPDSDPKGECKGKFPCQKRFDDYYVKNTTPDGRIYLKNILDIVCQAKFEGDRGGEFSYNKKRFLREWQMKSAMQGWLAAFGRTDSKGKVYLLIEDARRMLMDGKYPMGWTRRSWGSPLFGYRAFTRKLPCGDINLKEKIAAKQGAEQAAKQAAASAAKCAATAAASGHSCTITQPSSCDKGRMVVVACKDYQKKGEEYQLSYWLSPGAHSVKTDCSQCRIAAQRDEAKAPSE